MAKTPTTDKKPVKEARTLRIGNYRSFKLQKRLKAPESHIPAAPKIFWASLRIIRQNWKVFLGIMLIYGILNAVLVQSFNGSDLTRTKSVLDGFNSGGWGQLGGSFALFAYMAGSSGNLNSQTAGAYQLVLTIIVSLALIWTFREAYAGHRVRIRDGFYRGMYPLITFALVLFAAALQLVPAIVGAFLYNTVTTNGIAQGGVEITLWALILCLFVTVTLYMLSSSLFALYIICLPDMTPMLALRSARDLVRNRRWTVMRKVLFLPVALLVLALIVILPIIYLSAAAAGVAFFVLTMIALLLIHGYMYRLYRELL